MIESRLTLPSGLGLAYRDWGGGGRAVVLVHGLASSYRIWDLVAPLLAADFRVVAVDQRAHGRSDRPDGAFDLGTYAGDLRSFVETLGLGPSVFVGHSFGGNVVLQLAVDAPELVVGLVLVDGGFLELASREGWTWERTERELAPPMLDGIGRDELLERVRQGGLGKLWSPSLGESILGHFEPLPDGRLRPWLRREHHMKILRGLWEHHPSRLWRRVRCPVLLVPARQPNAQGRQAELQAAKEASVALAERELANSRTLWMEETVHDVPLQRPRELAAAIRELASRS